MPRKPWLRGLKKYTVSGLICHNEERRAIKDASRTLSLLKEQKLKDPSLKWAVAIGAKN
jgi:hypothetical protein